jgi:iron complex outermembrane recepter protein
MSQQMASYRIRLLLLAATALHAPLLAQSTDADNGQADYHATPSRDIIVTAPFARDRADILSGASVLQGVDLAQAIRPTIGETLDRTPGVSATSFGPNASRPVLRGLQGERVRVLTDGIGSIDVSNTSVDHAVAINPLLADRIEVLRGPSALLYGSSAIGGVVNVLDKRIPRRVPDEPIHIAGQAGYGSAASERSAAAAVDVPVGSQFVVHADGSYLKTDDLRIGGHVLTQALRDEATASSQLPADPDDPIDFAGNAALKNRLPNSAAKTWTAGIGAALITNTGSLGVSYSHYDSLYGVPVRYATAPGQEQEAPRLDLKQDRIDARAEVQTGGGFLEAIRGRFAYAKYRHFELEEDGEVGTAFYNKGLEGRVELAQTQRGAWKGASGVQYFSRDFNVIGEEAFLPKNSSQQIGFFTLQQLDLSAIKAEAGARYEHSRHTASPTIDQPQFFGGSRSFDTFSASAGASYALAKDWRLGMNLSRTVRAPSAEELFANGPHAGTEAFEIGNPDFRPEKSWGVEAILHGKGPGYTIEASVYHNWFDNFIYDTATGGLEDGLPVFQSFQAKARYYGFELQGSLTLAKLGNIELRADGLADYVHATIVGSGPAPRIPPLRLLGGIEAASPLVDGRIEVEWTDKQTRITTFETPTSGFTLVNASANFRPWGEHGPVTFSLSANNIFDVNARRHASFLKDYAPLTGRDIRISAHFTL